jgi:parallel beta-helix repeat protein
VGAAQDSTVGGTSAGAGNRIAFNNGPGIWVRNVTGSRIEGNLIYGNAGLGIVLGADANLNPLSTPNLNDSNDADANYLPSKTTATVSVLESIYALNSSASGAVSVTDNASINIAGLLLVDSRSSNALQAGGNGQVTASAIQVVGGASTSGSAHFSVAPVTGVASVFDPEAGLAIPTGGTSQGSVNLSGNSSRTINPGVYSQIKVSGNGNLTMNPGVYVIAGGGFSVTGNASVSGNGVLIYNAGSNYPNASGNFGGITLSGNGTINLSAPSTGPYAGIVIFQSRDNTRAISLSGNAAAGLNGGLIYAPQALLNFSGNAQLTHSPLIVGQLQLSGNGSCSLTDGSDSTNNTAGQLLAGDLSVYVDNSTGYFTPDELSAIQDAITNTNTLLAPDGVSVSEVSDPTQANITIDSNTTSALGGVAQGVLGCYTVDTGEITLIQGWDWYAGSDPTAIGADQYSFETTVTHELGYALGLGGSSAPSSPMFESLPTGVVKGALTVADLNLPPLDTTNADALHAAGFGSDSDNSVPTTTPIPAASAAGAAAGSRIGGDASTVPSTTEVALPGNVAPATPAGIASELATMPARRDLPGIPTVASAGLQSTISSWN